MDESPVWQQRAVYQAVADVKNHTRGFLIGTAAFALGPAVVLALNPEAASAGDRVRSAVVGTLLGLGAVLALLVLYALMVAPYRQRNAARRRVGDLEAAAAASKAGVEGREQKNRIVRELKMGRRQVMKNHGFLSNPQSPTYAPKGAHTAFLRSLRDAQEQLAPISSEIAGEFADLAAIVEANVDFGPDGGPRRSTIAMLMEDGDRLYGHAIERLSSPG